MVVKITVLFGCLLQYGTKYLGSPLATTYLLLRFFRSRDLCRNAKLRALQAIIWLRTAGFDYQACNRCCKVSISASLISASRDLQSTQHNRL